jgi:ankyrin repeat protein
VHNKNPNREAQHIAMNMNTVVSQAEAREDVKENIVAALSVVLNTRMLGHRHNFYFSAVFDDLPRQQHPMNILAGTNSSGVRPIHFAAATNNTTLLQNLLVAFAAFPSQFRMLVDARDSNGNTALHWCVIKGSVHAFVCLVKAGATLDLANFDGRTPLHLAVALYESVPEHSSHILNFLLHHGANPNVADLSGSTPLHLASELGIVPIIELLLEEGANVNTVDEEGESALFYALRGQSEAAVRKLVEYGIDISSRNSDGESAIDFCNAIGEATMVQLLESLQLHNEDIPMLNPRSLSMELSNSALSTSSGLWFSANEVKSSF